MKSLISHLIEECGLTEQEASAICGAPIGRVKSSSNPRAGETIGALSKLMALFALIEVRAELERRPAGSEEISLTVAADDDEAKSLGWPCVGAHRAFLVRYVARALESGYRIHITAPLKPTEG